MNFDFSEEQKLLQKTARDYLSENAPLGLCRKILEGDESYSRELWQAAAEMGWLGAAIPEEYGGAGFGQLELALIAEEIGRALAPIPFSSSVYLATEALMLAGTDEQKQRYLPRLASGELIGTFAIAERRGRPTPASIQTTFKAGELAGVKLPVPDGDVAGLAIVNARDDSGISLVIAELDAPGIERETLTSIDPSRSLARISFQGARAELLGTSGNGQELAESILDRAAVLMAFEQVGSAARAFEITKDFMMERYAFGRPIASFQALKHRMADLYVKIELARPNPYYGAWALSSESPELAVAACGARASACDAFDLSSQEMVQLHGGVGYTWEFDCHLFYRRAKLLSLALGNANEWRDKLIERLDRASVA